jgi:tRNA (mo5U34)-methyltransferase
VAPRRGGRHKLCRVPDVETTVEQRPDAAALRSEVEAHPLWYHTIELPGGVVTPGWFDLRPILDVMPWPDVRGKRCLDVGTYDGFLAFELERRGAAEVVATDLSDPSGWDWPVLTRDRGTEAVAAAAGGKTGLGFDIARRALGSRVERVEASVYELSPHEVGTYDVVVCGSLLLHLRDPVQALEAIRRVCDGAFLSAETVQIGLTLLHRRRPVAELKGDRNCQWWIPNVAGHRRMINAGGFRVEATAGPYAIPFGPGHPAHERPHDRLRQRALTRLVTGRVGVPHSAVLARPG